VTDNTPPGSTPPPARSTATSKRWAQIPASSAALAPIVKAAAALFDASSAVITVIDGGRHCTLADYGAEAAETPQVLTFSRYVAGTNVPLLVVDAAAEPRWAASFSASPRKPVRFYAGVPFRSAAGGADVVLSVFDRQPRLRPQRALIAVLEDLGRAAAAVMEAAMRPPTPLQQFQLWDSALGGCGSGVVVADARRTDMPVVYCNAAFERVTGYRMEEIAGANCRVLQGPDTDPAAVSQLHQAVYAGEGTRVLIRNYRKSGEAFWNELTVAPMREPDGTLTHFVGVQNDVSKRIEAERALRRVSALQCAILDATDFPLVATAIDGVITAMNRAARQLLRLDVLDPLPVNVASLFDRKELAARAAALSAGMGTSIEPGAEALLAPARSGVRDEREWTWIAADGSRVPVLLTCSAIHGPGGGTTGFLLSGADPDKHRTQLVEAARVKSLFLANVGHEIHTPLNAVIGMAGMLLDSGLTPAQRECAETIRQSGQNLLDILNDILDVTRIESGRMQIHAEAFDLTSCIAAAIQLFQPAAAAQGIVLALETGSEVPAYVSGDALRLRQILTNLIGNAVKFTPRGSVRIRVAAQPDPPGGASGWLLQFHVADTGIGIPADRLDQLFQPFSQVDPSSRRRHGGTGLGLAITRRLAELMGGGMEVRSELGAGSTFSFTVRVGRPETECAAGTAPDPPAPAPAPPLRILVAEDNPVNQKVALFLLRKLGYGADVVSNGEEVLERLRARTYDLILLDIQMPVMDGLQAARAVRSRFGHPGRPWLVALTANAETGDRQEALDAGMNDYLSKPVTAAELRAAIERAVKALQAGSAAEAGSI